MNEIPMPTIDAKEYKPRNEDILREYEVRLQFLNRGCVIHVGCKSIAFESIETAMKELNEYVSNTWEVQKKWRNLLDGDNY
jgi:hypothetical protein